MFKEVIDIGTFKENLNEQLEYYDVGFKIFQALQEQLNKSAIRLKNDKNWEVDDARLRLFDKMYQIVGGTLMNFIAHSRLFTSEAYYAYYGGEFGKETIEEANISKENLVDYAHNATCFMQNAISSYIHLLYSTIESSIRIFAREILGREFGDATMDFKNIYPVLIDLHCFKGKQQSLIDKQNRYKKIINLFAIIRNTIHNNGVYFNQEQEPIRLGKQNFSFEWGEPVFLTWDHLKVLTEGVIEAMDAIVRTEVISNPKYIKDPTPTVTTFNI